MEKAESGRCGNEIKMKWLAYFALVFQPFESLREPNGWGSRSAIGAHLLIGTAYRSVGKLRKEGSNFNAVVML